MQTSSETIWHGLATAADELFFPSITFGPGGAEGNVTLLVSGGFPGGAPGPAFVFRFCDVDAVCGYSETAYWSLAEAEHRPQHLLNRLETSLLTERLQAWRKDSGKVHFLLCGGDMCCEIVASEHYSISEYETAAAGRAVLAGELVRQFPDEPHLF